MGGCTVEVRGKITPESRQGTLTILARGAADSTTVVRRASCNALQGVTASCFVASRASWIAKRMRFLDLAKNYKFYPWETFVIFAEFAKNMFVENVCFSLIFCEFVYLSVEISENVCFSWICFEIVRFLSIFIEFVGKSTNSTHGKRASFSQNSQTWHPFSENVRFFVDI